MRDLLIIGFVFAMLPFCFFRPYIGALMWVWISLMNPHRLTWGPAYGFPFAMLVAATTMAGVLISKDRGRFPTSRETTLIIIMGIFFSLTTTVALMPEAAKFKWDQVIKIYIMTIVPMFLLQERNRLRLLLLTMCASIAFFSVKGGLFSLITRGQYRVFGPPGSFIADNNSLAVAELMVFPLMIHLGHTDKRKWVRRGLYVSAALTVISVIFSYSRGALLGLLAITAVYISTSKRWGLAIAFVILAGVGFYFIPHQWYDRMKTMKTYKQDESAMGRLQTWGFAISVANDRPFTGGGFHVFSRDQFLRYGRDPDEALDSHSIYFEVLGEHGYIGLALFLGLLASSFLTIRKVERRIRGNPGVAWAGEYCSMLRLSLVAYAVGGAFLGLAYFDLYYDVVAGVILLNMIVDREIRQMADSPASAPAAIPQALSA
jgi:probable O-glycosylation ligase (exosortase A-associated)